MSEQFDPFDETIRMREIDTMRVLEVGDTEVTNALAVEELMVGAPETVPSEDSDAAWDSTDLTRVARQLDRYRCRRTSWF